MKGQTVQVYEDIVEFCYCSLSIWISSCPGEYDCDVGVSSNEYFTGKEKYVSDISCGRWWSDCKNNPAAFTELELWSLCSSGFCRRNSEKGTAGRNGTRIRKIKKPSTTKKRREGFLYAKNQDSFSACSGREDCRSCAFSMRRAESSCSIFSSCVFQRALTAAISSLLCSRRTENSSICFL
mgnify:CR=1 FL=1